MCKSCKGRGDAHFGWCSEVGGVGHKPGSVQAVLATARSVATRLRDTRRVEHAKPSLQPRTNNGWHKPRAVGAPTPEPCPPAVMQASRPAVKQATGPKAGREVSDKDMRKVVNVAIEQGWRYECGGKHPRLHSPDGNHIVVFASTGGKGRGIANCVAQLKRLGVAL